MSVSKATFFISCMAFLHNRRVIREHVMSRDIVTPARFRELRAAYFPGKPIPADTPEEREKVARKLLKGDRKYSKSALAEYRLSVGSV